MPRADRIAPEGVRMKADPMTIDDIPAVCRIDDLVRILQTSRRTIEKRRKAGTFPIRELDSFDRHPRWSGAAVRAYLDGQGARFGRRRSA
jgi:hypothetical protein